MQGIINHLFRHSDKYRGNFSARRCGSVVPGLTAPGTSNQLERLFLMPWRGPSQGVVQRRALLSMPQDLCDQRWVLDTGNDPQLPATIGTGLDVNRKHPLEALELKLADTTLYSDPARKDELAAITRDQADVKPAIETHEWDWLAASEVLEEATSRD